MASTNDMVMFPGVASRRVVLRQGQRIGRREVKVRAASGAASPPLPAAGRGRSQNAIRVRGCRSINSHRSRGESPSSRPSPRKTGARGEESYADAVVTPPSTTMVWPVMKVEASEARIGHGARDLVGLADPAKRRGGAAALQPLLVLPQRAGEIGLHQTRRHAIDAHALRSPFAGEAAGEREVGGLGDAVGADHGRAAQAADRGDDDDRAFAALGHLRNCERAEPDVALDVRAHDLVEGLVLDVEQRAVIGVHRRVADQDVDLAVMLRRALDQRLDFVMARDVAGDDMRIAADFRMPSATSWQASALREEITTLAPSFASNSAEERPMPRLEPVTTATVPVRSNGVFFICWLPPLVLHDQSPVVMTRA